MTRHVLRANQVCHIVAGVFNLAYVYTPLHQWPHGITIVQFVTMPMLVLTGIALLRIPKVRNMLSHGAPCPSCVPSQLVDHSKPA